MLNITKCRLVPAGFACAICTLTVLMSTSAIDAQCNPPGMTPSVECADAPFTCLQDACYSTTNVASDNPHSGFCGPNTAVHNSQYFRLRALSEVMQIEIHVDSCGSGGCGLQAAIIGACDWELTDVLSCDPGTSQGGTMVLVANVDQGSIYWLLIDGCAGDICTYTITFVSGVQGIGDLSENVTTVDAPDVFCQSEDWSATASPAIPEASGYLWEGFPWSASPIVSTDPDLHLTIPPDVPAGIYEICVRAYNGCDTSDIPFYFDIEVPESLDGEAQPIGLCSEELANGYQWHAQLITSPGVYTQQFGEINGCMVDSTLEVMALPQPPAHDLVCTAQQIPLQEAGHICLTGESLSCAQGEVPVEVFDALCQSVVQRTLWYRIETHQAGTTGLHVEIPHTSIPGDLSIVLFENGPCDSPGGLEMIDFYCGPAPAGPLTFDNAEDDADYYLMIGAAQDSEGDFDLCVFEVEACYDNDHCSSLQGINTARDLGIIFSADITACLPGTSAFVCDTGCNYLAFPDPGFSVCLDDTDPVVWYTFQTDGVASLLNIHVSSDELASPAIQLWWSPDGTCDNLELMGLTSDFYTCITGSGGILTATGTEIWPHEQYFLAVGAVNSLGGNFSLCMSVVDDQARQCVTDAGIRIVDRSLGGPLEGPFYPGETLSICMEVSAFTVSTGIGNCQWMQGVVPVFGNGWDSVSFNAEGQPVNATMNGSALPASNVHNGGQWDWWTDVTYHHDHCYFNVGDFDGNGTLDICNSLYDPTCSGPGLAEGCCSSCWNAEPGTQLPPGWFTSGVAGLCPIDGHPAFDWGDGNTCNGPTGPWNFCFDLKVREDTHCAPDDSTTDLTIGFVTFADGETGSWNGGPSVCGQDAPVIRNLPLCCINNDLDDALLPPICSGDTFSWTTDIAGIDYWEWIANLPPGVTGGSDGTGSNGDTVSHVLFNNGTAIAHVYYDFIGYANGCEAAGRIVNIEVYPSSDFSLPDTISICDGKTATLEAPAGFVHYQWSTGDTTATTTVSDSGIVTLIATDSFGCSIEKSIQVISEGASYKEDVSLSICAGDSVILHGTTYSSPGTYLDTIAGLDNSCDTIVTITIVVEPVTVTDTSVVICDGGSVEIGGKIYTEPGAYQINLISAEGCDSVILLGVQMVQVFTFANDDAYSIREFTPVILNFTGNDIITGRYEITFEGVPDGLYIFQLSPTEWTVYLNHRMRPYVAQFSYTLCPLDCLGPCDTATVIIEFLVRPDIDSKPVDVGMLGGN